MRVYIYIVRAYYVIPEVLLIVYILYVLWNMARQDDRTSMSTKYYYVHPHLHRGEMTCFWCWCRCTVGIF